MKKLIGLLFCIASLNNVVYADGNTAKLSIQISGIGSENKLFLCSNENGCYSMLAAKKGKIFPVTTGEINRIFLMNASNLRTYFQTLPSSCKVTLDANQTLTVKGKIVKGVNDNLYVKDMKCSVS